MRYLAFCILGFLISFSNNKAVDQAQYGNISAIVINHEKQEKIINQLLKRVEALEKKLLHF